MRLPADGDTPLRLVLAPAPTLCLDYANTRYWRGSDTPTESLTDFGALERWLETAGAVDPATGARLQALRRVDPDAAQRLFDDAVDLREMLYRLFAALAGGTVPAAESHALGEWLVAAPPRRHWVLEGRRAGWFVPMVAPLASEVLAPVLWSAADLALAVQRVRLRQCANEKCRWLFVDDNKGGSRRWCSMSTCGNRAKVQRHAQRKAGRALP
jgi:predicted RNA-binding Zn ribbon-like protein